MLISLALPAEHLGEHFNRNLFYNAVKRNEEDLLNHIPTLEIFNLVVRPCANAATTLAVSADHILTHDESELTLNIWFRNACTHQRILKEVSIQILCLKKLYY